MQKKSSITVFYSLILSLSLFLSLFPAFAAHSAEKAQNEASPLASLYNCAKINSPDKRLACYDKEVGRIEQAEAKKQLVAIDAKAAKKIKKEAFGFNIPSLPKIGLPKIGADSKKETLTEPVKTVRRVGRKYVITLKNGQVWQETGGHFNYIPKGDLTATIKKKSMGSYMISISNGKTRVRGLRVRRIK